MVAFSSDIKSNDNRSLRQRNVDNIKRLFPENKSLFTYIGFSAYYLAIPVTVLSWVVEIFFGTSIWAACFPAVSCPTILRANVVLEVVKAVGLSTAFIMLVYNSLDKRTHGLRYGDIIQHYYAYYWMCSAIHVIFTLGGIASGVAGASESALLSLFVVLFGLYIQWKVVHKIILNKSEREYLADQLWKYRIEDQASAQEIREVVLQLGNEITASNGYFSNILMNRFAHAFVMFASKDKLNIRVSHISDIWAVCLKGIPDSNQGTLTGEILAACINCSEIPLSVRKSALISICGGYVAYQIQHEVSSVNNVEEKLALIADSIGCLFYRVPVEPCRESQDLTNDVYHYMCTIFTAMAWLAFFRSQITFNDEILGLKALADKKECKMCILETARAIFPIVDANAEHKLEELAEKAYNFTIQATV